MIGQQNKQENIVKGRYDGSSYGVSSEGDDGVAFKVTGDESTVSTSLTKPSLDEPNDYIITIIIVINDTRL